VVNDPIDYTTVYCVGFKLPRWLKKNHSDTIRRNIALAGAPIPLVRCIQGRVVFVRDVESRWFLQEEQESTPRQIANTAEMLVSAEAIRAKYGRAAAREMGIKLLEIDLSIRLSQSDI